MQLFGHLASDVACDLFDVLIALQITARNVEGNIRRINYTVQQCQELRYNLFHLIRHIHLVGVQLNLVALHVKTTTHLRKVEYSGKIEGVVNVEVNPKHGRLAVRMELLIKRPVVFVSQICRLFLPDGVGVIDDVGNLNFYRFFFLSFPFVNGLFTQSKLYWNGQETAIFFEQSFDAAVFQKFIAVLADVQNNICTTVTTFSWFEPIRGISFTGPTYCLFVSSVRTRHYLNAISNHES